jgi:hypothetical protein
MLKLLAVLFAAGKLGKVATTGLTMLVSIGVYALVFGFWYAVGFVLLILIHEMGHYIAAKQKGLNVGAPTFIPFVGAWIQMKELPHSVETEAYVGMGGPLVGTAGARRALPLATEPDAHLRSDPRGTQRVEGDQVRSQCTGKPRVLRRAGTDAAELRPRLPRAGGIPRRDDGRGARDAGSGGGAGPVVGDRARASNRGA